jgi:hypothetical protein
MTEDGAMTIDLDALERFCDENPVHASPRDELEAIFDYVDDIQCLLEATYLLGDWERNNAPLELQRAQADFFFMKWNFTDAKGQPWRPAGAKDH